MAACLDPRALRICADSWAHPKRDRIAIAIAG